MTNANGVFDGWQATTVPPLNSWLGDPDIGPLGLVVERAVHMPTEADVATGAPAVRWACWPSADLAVDVDEFLETFDRTDGFPLDQLQITTAVGAAGAGVEEMVLPVRCDHCSRVRASAGDGSALPMAVVPISTGRLIVLVGLCWPCADDIGRDISLTIACVFR